MRKSGLKARDGGGLRACCPNSVLFTLLGDISAGCTAQAREGCRALTGRGTALQAHTEVSRGVGFTLCRCLCNLFPWLE